MEINKFAKQKGFTLIEVMIALAIFVMLIFGVSKMLSDIFINSNQEVISMSNIDQARSALSTFTNEIRNSVTGVDGSYPLNQTGDSQIVFFSNYKVSNSAVARIRYYIDGNILYKGVVLPSGSPLSYNLLNESVKVVATGISNSGSPLFYYYDGNYNGNTSALAQPVNINQVRFVKMSLMVLNNIKQNDTSKFSISAGSAIRSVKDNLGN